MNRNEELVDLLESSACHLREWAKTEEAVAAGSNVNAVLLAERLESIAGSWQTRTDIRGIYKADDDKPHRCPVCWRIPDIVYEKHASARLWYIYTCQNGHRFTRIPFIGKEYK